LPLPQNLYPSELGGASLDTSGNKVTIPAGAAIPVPPGEWNVGLGMYLLLQFLDPITNTWVMTASGGWQGTFHKIFSDGYNYRVANLLACPIGAAITNAGGNYVQASTTISVTGGGGSTWAPIVGGQLAVSGGTLVSNGAGYGVTPLALLPAPPPPQSNANGVGGVQASGYFTIAGGTVSGFTFTNPGAGYASGFTIAAQPSPYDPNNATGITLATIAFSLAAAGSLTGVLCTNPGAALATPANITLTVAGVGTAATISPIVLQTIVKASVTGAGTGYGTVGVLLTTFGGAPGTAVFANSPETLYLAGKPRPADIGIATTGTGGTLAVNALGSIYDGGFFYSAPSIAIASGAQSGSVSGATIVLTMGSVPDIAVLQPGS
jgi:hypothetical protein